MDESSLKKSEWIHQQQFRNTGNRMEGKQTFYLDLMNTEQMWEDLGINYDIIVSFKLLI